MKLPKEYEDKGNEAEDKFKEWLNKQNIPYLYVKQNLKDYSKSIKEKFQAKHPDFIIFIKNIGLIFVDVKNKKVYLDKEIGESFACDLIEQFEHFNLQRHFNIPVWIVCSNKELEYKKWYWITNSKIEDLQDIKGDVKKSNKSNKDFFVIPKREFVEINNEDDYEILLTKCFVKYSEEELIPIVDEYEDIEEDDEVEK